MKHQLHLQLSNIFLILVEGGYQFNTPFKPIRQLSSSLVTYFFDLYSNGLLNEDLKHNLLHVINSSDQFDNALIDMFDAIFPHQITIENTNYSFVCFPFKKTLDYLLKKFDSFCEKGNRTETFKLDNGGTPSNSPIFLQGCRMEASSN